MCFDTASYMNMYVKKKVFLHHLIFSNIKFVSYLSTSKKKEIVTVKMSTFIKLYIYIFTVMGS